MDSLRKVPPEFSWPPGGGSTYTGPGVYASGLGNEKDAYEADRMVLDRFWKIQDTIAEALRAHLQHVHRVVRFLAHEGIDQFLLSGTWVPLNDLAHESIHAINPLARVVYVERDAVALSRAAMKAAQSTDRVWTVALDYSHPERILQHRVVRSVLDWERPIAVCLPSMYAVAAEGGEPPQALAEFRARMVPGSFLWLASLCYDGYGKEVRDTIAEYNEALGVETHDRTFEQTVALFGGFDLVDPGVVWIPQWRPQGDSVLMPAHETGWLCGVAKRPLDS